MVKKGFDMGEKGGQKGRVCNKEVGEVGSGNSMGGSKTTTRGFGASNGWLSRTLDYDEGSSM